MVDNGLAVDIVPDRLFKRFKDIIKDGFKDGGESCLVKHLSKREPVWTKRFYRLLLETIKYWGSPRASCGINQKMPKKYSDFYGSLNLSQIAFPPNNIYLDWPFNIPDEERTRLGIPLQRQVRSSGALQQDSSAALSRNSTLGQIKTTRRHLTELIFSENIHEDDLARTTAEYLRLSKLINTSSVEYQMASDYLPNSYDKDLVELQDLMADVYTKHMSRNIFEDGIDYSDDEQRHDDDDRSERAAEVIRIENEKKREEERKLRIEEDKRKDEERKRKENEERKKQVDEEKKRKEGEEKKRQEDELKKREAESKRLEKERAEKENKENQERESKLKEQMNKKEKKKTPKSVRFKDDTPNESRNEAEINGSQFSYNIIPEVDPHLEDSPTKNRVIPENFGSSQLEDDFSYSMQASQANPPNPQPSDPSPNPSNNARVRSLRLDAIKSNLSSTYSQQQSDIRTYTADNKRMNDDLHDRVVHALQTSDIDRDTRDGLMADAGDRHALTDGHLTDMCRVAVQRVCDDYACELDMIDADDVVYLRHVKKELEEKLDRLKLDQKNVRLPEYETQHEDIKVYKEQVSRLSRQSQTKKSNLDRSKEYLENTISDYQKWLSTSKKHKPEHISGYKVNETIAHEQLNTDTSAFRKIQWDTQITGTDCPSAEQIMNGINVESLFGMNKKESNFDVNILNSNRQAVQPFDYSQNNLLQTSLSSYASSQIDPQISAKAIYPQQATASNLNSDFAFQLRALLS